MSQSRPGGEGRTVHQDYIARIRCSNALPPPSIPPKLLHIPMDAPNPAQASSLYATSDFASRVRRKQPLNIEPDAELGMPLDLVGMPGVFDGDESSIQPSSTAPYIHPRDLVLLRPLSTLGKPKAGSNAVTFLRRTEYIASSQAKQRGPANVFLKASSASRKQAAPPKQSVKRKASPEPDRGTPAWIKRRAERSFEVAASHLRDRGAGLTHPSRRGARVVEVLPLLPDLDAFPDSGAYVTVKFKNAPTTNDGQRPADQQDTRLSSAILQPIQRSEAEEEAYNAALAAHKADPRQNPMPHNMMDYDIFLPSDIEAGEKFRMRFDVDNPDRDRESLYTCTAAADKAEKKEPYFRYDWLRAYETYEEKEMTHDNKYDDEVILAFSNRDGGADADGDRGGSTKGSPRVYYYPIMQRSTLRNQRTKNIARTAGVMPVEDRQHLDELHVRVDDPSPGVRRDLLRFRDQPVGYLHNEDDEDDDDDDDDGDDVGSAALSQPPAEDVDGNGEVDDDNDHARSISPE